VSNEATNTNNWNFIGGEVVDFSGFSIKIGFMINF